MLIPAVYRSDMVKIAQACPAPMTQAMQAFIDHLVEIGQYAKATEGEIELFDELFDEMFEEVSA
tara:strand:+ start:310 stop:501 length:192 start_codon:yes stop_codon:yes gene_type:complete